MGGSVSEGRTDRYSARARSSPSIPPIGSRFRATIPTLNAQRAQSTAASDSPAGGGAVGTWPTKRPYPSAASPANRRTEQRPAGDDPGSVWGVASPSWARTNPDGDETEDERDLDLGEVDPVGPSRQGVPELVDDNRDRPSDREHRDDGQSGEDRLRTGPRERFGLAGRLGPDLVPVRYGGDEQPGRHAEDDQLGSGDDHDAGLEAPLPPHPRSDEQAIEALGSSVLAMLTSTNPRQATPSGARSLTHAWRRR